MRNFTTRQVQRNLNKMSSSNKKNGGTPIQETRDWKNGY